MLVKFWVSGRDLLDKQIPGSSTDPYYIVCLSDDEGKTRTEIGRSDTMRNQLNPDWTNVFEVKIDRSKNQYLHFQVMNENSLPEDGSLGSVWVNVADYVKKGQNDNPNLDKKGYLLITNADGAVGSGMLRMPYGPYGTPDKQTLKFKISAKGLPIPSDHDFGVIPMKGDPYVVLSLKEGPAGITKEVSRTNPVPCSSDPKWNDVMTLEWIQDKDQRLRFSVCDDDLLHSNDHLGQAWIQVNDFVAKEEIYTVLLPIRGSITIQRA